MDILYKVRKRLRKVKKRSYALNNLDLKLWDHLKFENGFFIEAGANDGIKQSNTLYLERYYGWKGLLIEAIPELAQKCSNNRKKCIVENCALVSNNYSKEVIEIHYCGLMSAIESNIIDLDEHIKAGRKFLKNGEADYKVTVPARTLNMVLEKNNISRIDLLSLDVEGYEIEVLNGLDLNKFKPKYILIEVRNIDLIFTQIGEFYKIKSILNDNKDYMDILFERRIQVHQ